MIKHAQIKRIKNAYKTLVEGKEEKTYDFSCVMLDTLDDQLVKTVKSIKEGIDSEDLSKITKLLYVSLKKLFPIVRSAVISIIFPLSLLL